MLKFAVISLGFILFNQSVVCTKCPVGCVCIQDRCLLCKQGHYHSGETCIKCAGGCLAEKNAVRNKRNTLEEDPDIKQKLQKYNAWKSCVVAYFKKERLFSRCLDICASCAITSGISTNDCKRCIDQYVVYTMGISGNTNINCSITCAGRQCNKSGYCMSGCLENKLWGKLWETSCPEKCLLCDKNSGNCLRCKNDTVFGPQCTTCPTTCLNGSCEQTFGKCMFGCKNGFYGDTCQIACKENCWNGTCRHDNGACDHHFPDAVSSKQADKDKLEELHMIIIWILGTVCVLLAATFLVIVVQSRIKCEKRTNTEGDRGHGTDVDSEQANNVQLYHHIQVADQNPPASWYLARSESSSTTRDGYIHPI